MDELETFLTQTQDQISNNTKVIISIGTFLDNPHILNCSLSTITIKNILEGFDMSILKYKNLDERVYRTKNIEYTISTEGEKNISKQYLLVNNIEIDKVGLRFKLVEFISRPLEEFPCQLNYDDEFNKSTIIIYYDNLLEIHINTEQRDITTQTIEIHITKQNIYPKRLININKRNN